jgi:GldM N-terminal domain
MRYTLSIAILFVLVCSRCQSPSDKIVADFKKVNESLDKTNAAVGRNSLELYNRTIQGNKEKNPALAQTADSLFHSFNRVYDFIDSLKQQLLVDSSGTDMTISDKLLLQSGAGNELMSKLAAVNKYCYLGLTDTGKKTELDGVLHSIQNLEKGATSLEQYFKNAPSIAAVTILSKFQNDCINATNMVLWDIRGHVGNQ